MALTLSEVVIPTYKKGLDTLTHILTVAKENAGVLGLDPDAEYFGASLADDMLPLKFQVQNATKTVRRTLACLQGTEDQPWADDEKTMADLLIRVEKARAVVEAADKNLIDARVEEIVYLPMGLQPIQAKAKAAALNQGIPNFFFHLQTAYAILRAKGVPIGKRDYIGHFLAS